MPERRLMIRFVGGPWHNRFKVCSLVPEILVPYTVAGGVWSFLSHSPLSVARYRLVPMPACGNLGSFFEYHHADANQRECFASGGCGRLDHWAVNGFHLEGEWVT